MIEIPLTQGQVALVDDEDYEELSKYKWCAAWWPHCKSYCAVRGRTVNGKSILIYMHRVILGAQRGQEVDHRNHNTLDNRRCNLRACTRSENQHNQRPQAGRTSAYKGVHWQKSARKWKARIHVGGQDYYLGLFTDERTAAERYDAKARELFGEFAYLNFPTPGSDAPTPLGVASLE